MHQHNKRRYSYLVLGLSGLFLLLLQFSGILPVIGSCYPMLLLPLTLVCGAYFGAFPGALGGAVIGTVADIFTGGTPTFHMIIFSLLGCAAGLLITYYFNHNWQVMAIITVLSCLLYYFLKWLFFYLQPGSFFSYFLTVGVFSALYTALMSIPIYAAVYWGLRRVTNAE